MVPVKLNCTVCGGDFYVPPVRKDTAKYCSTTCKYKVCAASRKKRTTFSCKVCKKVCETHECHKHLRVYCSRKCMFSDPDLIQQRRERVSGANNPMYTGTGSMHISKSGRKYRRGAPESENERCVKRKRAKDRATPAWYDQKAALDVYRKARLLSKETGIKHHVDHVVPLTSELVCGLHWHGNLVPIPAFENLSKANRVWPDMP